MLKSRLLKLEKLQKDNQLANDGIYLVFTDGETMEITVGHDLIFSGTIPNGEKMIEELESQGALIVQTNTSKECAR